MSERRHPARRATSWVVVVAAVAVVVGSPALAADDPVPKRIVALTPFTANTLV